MKNQNTKTLVTAAMFAAMITILTAFFQIKIGINDGYIHFGDSIIYLAACILPAPYALCAASIGGALADILSGAAIWAIPTAIIKALNVVPFVLMMSYLKKENKADKIISKGTIFMAIISGLITVLGYYVAEGIMFGFTAALLSSLLRGLIQPIGSAIVFYAIGLALDKAKFKTLVVSR